jgi:hypothetical protein
MFRLVFIQLAESDDELFARFRDTIVPILRDETKSSSLRAKVEFIYWLNRASSYHRSMLTYSSVHWLLVYYVFLLVTICRWVQPLNVVCKPWSLHCFVFDSIVNRRFNVNIGSNIFSVVSTCRWYIAYYRTTSIRIVYGSIDILVSSSIDSVE